ncbi:hypothetical protein GDO81_022537 [Engystomops pustulosus]|uniref:Uncharacterized protein n=1 Tax=Engystomops pustulosus TaxID=76066 RepID=A0AAV6YPC0_ENGPU|nr:hypothetical protein GDO81_022537 [Engystomops pustulosus]
MEVVALVAVTVLLGGIVVLLALWGRKGKEGSEEEESAEKANGHAVPEKPTKKQKPQRPRKEKVKPHSFSHPLLASALKVTLSIIKCSASLCRWRLHLLKL